ncbi:uncharacterized protein [Malus domestica]|uniref:uncharacterized protein n=1 Tax=Malus domestica TaxID=3750 RepID=UPI003975170C
MKLICWNCQGIGRDLTIANLMEQNWLHSPEVVALLETKNNSQRFRFLKRRLGMSCMHAIEPRGIAGGLCVFWKDAKDVVLVKYGEFFIEVLIADGVRNLRWRLVVVYASTVACTRAQQFEVLRTRLASLGEPCLVMGDFNDLLLESEKIGGNGRTVSSMRTFRTFVAQTKLLDLGFVGYPYTWRNRREEGFIQERLDRALATHDWIQSYQQTVVKHVVLEGSDHAMLVLSTEVDQPRRTKRFMYDRRWNLDPKCDEIVRACWGTTYGGSHALNILHSLRRVRYGLLTWQKKEAQNKQKEICKLKAVLREAYNNRCLMVLKFVVWKRNFHEPLKGKKFIGVRSQECNGCVRGIKTLGSFMLKP